MGRLLATFATSQAVQVSEFIARRSCIFSSHVFPASGSPIAYPAPARFFFYYYRNGFHGTYALCITCRTL